MAMNNLTSHRRPPIIGVWVDENVDDHLEMKQHLRQISLLIEKWHFFKDIQVFYDFLDDDPKNQIFLVMSGKAAQSIVPAKHDYANIHSMYIYCHSVEYHRNLKTQYDKVKDVMNSPADLYQRIADELSLLLIEIGESYVNSQDRFLAKSHLEEALRLMSDTLHWSNQNGRIVKTNDLLHRLDTWNEDLLYSRS